MALRPINQKKLAKTTSKLAKQAGATRKDKAVAKKQLKTSAIRSAVTKKINDKDPQKENLSDWKTVPATGRNNRSANNWDKSMTAARKAGISGKTAGKIYAKTAAKVTKKLNKSK